MIDKLVSRLLNNRVVVSHRIRLRYKNKALLKSHREYYDGYYNYLTDLHNAMLDGEAQSMLRYAE